MPAFAGFFSDGRTAARRSVSILLEGEGLVVEADDGTLLRVWALGELRLIDEPGAAGPVRLTSAREPAARLSVYEHTTGGTFLEALPQAPGRLGAGGPVRWRRVAALALAGAAALAGVTLAAPRLLDGLARLVPADFERALGESVARDLLRLAAPGHGGGGFCGGSPGVAALERLSGRLGASVTTPHPFRVRVADADMVNAFAAPGGHIVLMRGLIDEARSPDEVAGVLAHEMGHVIERHPMKGLIRHLGLSAIIDAFVGDSSSLVEAAAELGGVLVTLSYGRAAEAEADGSAVALLTAAGMRTDGLAAFFGRLAEKESSSPGIAGFLSTHPPSEARARAIDGPAGAAKDAMTEKDWEGLRAICGPGTTGSAGFRPPRRAGYPRAAA